MLGRSSHVFFAGIPWPDQHAGIEDQHGCGCGGDGQSEWVSARGLD